MAVPLAVGTICIVALGRIQQREETASSEGKPVSGDALVS